MKMSLLPGKLLKTLNTILGYGFISTVKIPGLIVDILMMYPISLGIHSATLLRLLDMLKLHSSSRLYSLHQGMSNMILNASLLSMVAVAVIITYLPALNIAFRTRQLRLVHFGMPAIPFFILIFTYDEVRKWLIRHQRIRLGDKPGPVEKYTFY
jgi:hypothetical protein